MVEKSLVAFANAYTVPFLHCAAPTHLVAMISRNFESEFRCAGTHLGVCNTSSRSTVSQRDVGGLRGNNTGGKLTPLRSERCARS